MMETTSIGDLIDAKIAELQTGPFGTQLKASEYTRSGTPVINVRNVGFGEVRPDQLEHVGPETRERLAQHLLRAGDIVFGRKGAVERHAFLQEEHEGWMQGSDCIRLRLAPGGPLIPRFVSYYLSTPLHRQWMLNQSSHGATMASLNQDILRRLTIPTPTIDLQRKTVGILAGYDELIANNLVRIEVLEEMAQAIYREWFVNFRYPGHEADELVDSPLGQVPEGWESTTVGEAFEVLGGATPSTKQPRYWEGGEIDWYTPSDLTAHGHMLIAESGRRITQAGLDACSARLFPAGSVMMTSRATLGVTAINVRPACTNQGFITGVPNDRVPAAQIYFWIRENLESILGHASGATFREISKRVFRTLAFVMAPRRVGEAFSESVNPILGLIENLIAQNGNLRVTRDLLIPRLVSGEIDASDLDIDTSWSAA